MPSQDPRAKVPSERGTLETSVPSRVTAPTTGRVAGQSPRVERALQRAAALDLLALYDHPQKDRDFRKRLLAFLLGVHQTRPRGTPSFGLIPLRERDERRAQALTAFLADSNLSSQLAIDVATRLGEVGGVEVIPLLARAAKKGSARLWSAAREAIARIEQTRSMLIVFVAMEVKPYSGVGGLGNVMKELPKALVRRGHRVIVLTPRHASIDRSKLIDTGWTGEIVNCDGREPFQILKDSRDGVDIYFIENDLYFSANRPGIYGDRHGPFGDNDKRYDFFGASVPQALTKILKGTRPDIIQLNDAHTGSAAVYLRNDASFNSTKIVTAVHNLGAAYQGRFPGHHLEHFMFDRALFYPAGPAEFYGEVNLLKLGLTHADGVLFVSRRYMEECLGPERGEGLHGVLQEVAKRRRLWGCLNGVDYETWNPASDEKIPVRYDLSDLPGKAACKAALQKAYGLAERPEVPLIGALARLDWQKGWEDVMRAVRYTEATDREAQFVLSGTGSEELEERLIELAEQHPGRVVFDPKFSPEKEHAIYAGADLFLMPSRFEPCGLPQMYALRYLTVPIVHAVGGLDESIEEYDPKEGTGNGFKFKRDLTGAIDRALDWYESGPEGRQELLELCASCDFSWETTTGPELAAFYRELLFAP